MKVLTKSVLIEGEEFALIKDNSERGEYLGTIPYTELNEEGRMKRPLNGFEMCIEFINEYESLGAAINAAIKSRKDNILTKRFLAAHPEIDFAANKNVELYVNFILSL